MRVCPLRHMAPALLPLDILLQTRDASLQPVNRHSNPRGPRHASISHSKEQGGDFVLGVVTVR